MHKPVRRTGNTHTGAALHHLYSHAKPVLSKNLPPILPHDGFFVKPKMENLQKVEKARRNAHFLLTQAPPHRIMETENAAVGQDTGGRI